MAHLRTDTNEQNKIFARRPTISKPRNVFPLIKKGATTHQFDLLHVLYSKEIYPGDTINLNIDFLARLQTQITDLFDDIFTDVHVWYDPCRNVQTDFNRLFFDTRNTPSQDNSALTTPAIIPELVGANDYQFAEKSLYDDLEYPTKVNFYRSLSSTNVLHMPNYKARIYNHIWNTNYRDQNLQNPRVLDLDNGPDAYADYATHAKRGKRPDMPTSALPFRQKGTEPLVPMTGTADIFRYDNAGTWQAFNNGTNTLSPNGAVSLVGGDGSLAHSGSGGISLDPNGGLYAALSSGLAGFYINDLRYSIAVQQLLEQNALGGTRDIEALSNIWGVEAEDFRLDRPEYLGGATFTFDGHVVPQTSETGTTPQGNLAQFSQQLSGLSIMHSFKEYGFLMVLVSHRSNQTYQNMLKREDAQVTRWDFYNPIFANLGEVSVKNREVWTGGSNGLPGEQVDDEHFGWQQYAYWLRYDQNSVTREMKSNATNSFDTKHLAYDFQSTPQLNAAFIESDTSAINRNITVDTDEVDPIKVNFKISGTIARMLPMYSVPGLEKI